MNETFFSSHLLAAWSEAKKFCVHQSVGARCLWLAVLLCGAVVSANAQSRKSGSVISVTVADGMEAQKDAVDPNIFTIQCGAYNTEQPTEFYLTLNEAAAYPVSVELRTVSIGRYYSCPISIDDEEPIWEHAVVTFEPGETSKKISFSPSIEMEELVYSAPTVGRKPFYIELLYPSRATLDVRLVEFVYSFDTAPGEEATTNYSVATIGGNFALPLYWQDGYCFFYLQPQNDDGDAPFMRITDETSVSFSMPQADFDAREGDELPTTVSATVGEVSFTPRHQQDSRSSVFTCMHRFSQDECLRQAPQTDFTQPFSSTDGQSEFDLMSTPTSAGPFFSPVSADNSRPITVEGADISTEASSTTFQLIHATPYISHVQTAQQQYVAGQQMDVSFEITNWRFYYTVYRETMLQNLFVTFDGGLTRQPLANATMTEGVVSAAVTAPDAAGSYCLEIGVTVNDWTGVSEVATQEYYPATAFANVNIVAGTAPTVDIQTKAIAGVPDVISYTSDDVHRQYQAYVAVTPVTAACPDGTWSVSRNDGQQDDILAIDADGNLTLKRVNDEFGYDFARSGVVTITYACPDFTLTKEVTLLPVVPAGITFYYADQQQDVYGTPRNVVIDYQVKADDSWSLATEGTATMTVTAKDGQQRTIAGIYVSTLQSSRTDDGVLHVYVPLTLSDHEYSLLERHGESWQLVWTVKTDIQLPFTNSISQTDYSLATFRYVNYAYDPVRIDALPKYTAFPVMRDIYKGKTDYVVTHAYNLPKDSYFMVHWDVKSDEQWNGQSSYHFTTKRLETWESTQGIENLPDWLQLLDRGDGYYDAKIIVPIETADCEGRMMPVKVYIGASSEPGDDGSGVYGVTSYLHYNLFNKEDFKVYIAQPFNDLDNATKELTEGSTLQLSDEAQIGAFRSALATPNADLFNAIARVRKSNILTIDPIFTGESYGDAGYWVAQQSKVIITGGQLGGDTIRGRCLYFPIAEGTYKIEVINETVDMHHTFYYTTHDLEQKKDLYVYYSFCEAYMQNNQAQQFVLPQFVDFVYITKSGEVKTVSHREKKTQWFYEPDDIVGFYLLGENGDIIYNRLNYYHASIDNYSRPFEAPRQAYTGRPFIFDEIENRNPLFRNVIYEDDGDIHLSLHNMMGEAVTDAHVNYVAVDGNGSPTGAHAQGVAVGDDGRIDLPYRDVVADPYTSSLYIEVVAPGYEPKFYKYNATNQSYRHNFSSQPTNEVDLVLETADEAITKFCRADLMSIVEANADTTAVTFAITDLTGYNLVDKVSYKEEGPLGGPKSIYAIQNSNGVYGFFKRWEGEKFLQLDLTFPKESTGLDYSHMTLTGIGSLKDVEPTKWQEIKSDYFEHDYVDATFDLVGFVPNEKMAIPTLKVGLADYAQLPKLHNEEIDMDSIARNTKINIMTNPDFNPGDIGKESAARGGDVGEDNQQLFDQIDFDFPEVMGFQFQVKKVGNHFQVRGVYSKNFLPGGDEADMVDSFAEEMVGYANQFDKVFKDCVDACTGGSGGDEDFDFLYGNDPLFATNDAFVGIRAFISGVAYLGPKGEFMMNFHEGGIKLEMSGEYTHKCSFGIGSFGAKLSGELSTQLKLINHKAAAGDVYNFSLNVMVETEVRAEIVAWATAGLNILNLVKAEVGVRGGVSASYKSGISYPLYGNPSGNDVYAGHKLSLRSGMFVYADARFLWWRKHWEKWLFKFSKDFIWPDDPMNPYSDDFAYGPSLFSTKPMGGRSWRKVKARRVVGLGQTLMNDVSGMASPRLFNGGQNIIYNKLNSPTNYNDDRLMMRSLADGSDVNVNSDATEATGAAFAFDVAERGQHGAAAFEQYRTADLTSTAVEQGTSMDAMNQMSAGVDVVASIWNGSSWQSTVLPSLAALSPSSAALSPSSAALSPSSIAGDFESPVSGTANLSPRVAVQDDGHAAVVWLSGTSMATEAEDEADRQQYLEGSYLLSRYDGTQWSQPIELARLCRSFVVSDHRMVMHGDSLFIIMEHQDEVSSKENPYIDYICVTPKNAVSTQFGIERGRNPQVVRMGDVNMVGYLTQRPDSTQDIRLRTVDMGNNPVAATDSYARLGKRSVGSFKLTATADAASLDDLALIWTQSVLNPETDETESWLCAGRFGKSGQQLYLSYPEQVVRIPDDFTPSAFDGYIDEDNLHVVYALSDISNDGTAVIQKDVKFTNSVRVKDCVIVAANATSADNIPFRLSVQNTGYAPITALTADMGDTHVEFTDMNLMPGETADLAAYFAINTDNYDGQEQLQLTAQFGGMSVALARRKSMSQSSVIELPRLMQRTITSRSDATALLAARRAATDPTMTASATVDCQVQATDLSCTVVSNRIRDTRNSVIAKVTNCSPLPLLSGQTVTAGLYASAADTEPIEGTSLVTIPTSELYADGKPLTKMIRLQADDLTDDMQAIIKVVVSDGSESIVTDIRPENNHVPVSLYRDDGSMVAARGDVNRDGSVDMADVTALASIILGKDNTQPYQYDHNAADVNGNGGISIADVTALLSIILGK